MQAALAQAIASERQAGARLAGLRSSGRSGAQAGVAQAESVLAAARADLQRTRELLAHVATVLFWVLFWVLVVLVWCWC